MRHRSSPCSARLSAYLSYTEFAFLNRTRIDHGMTDPNVGNKFSDGSLAVGFLKIIVKQVPKHNFAKLPRLGDLRNLMGFSTRGGLFLCLADPVLCLHVCALICLLSPTLRTCSFNSLAAVTRRTRFYSPATAASGEQGAVFGDPVVATAILDRLLHHSDVTTIRCDSYRLKEKRRNGLLQKPAAADQSRRKRLERCPEHRKPLARYDISRRARIAPLCQRM